MAQGWSLHLHQNPNSTTQEPYRLACKNHTVWLWQRIHWCKITIIFLAKRDHTWIYGSIHTTTEWCSWMIQSNHTWECPHNAQGRQTLARVLAWGTWICQLCPQSEPYKSPVTNHPNKAFYGKKPSISTLHIFGSQCHVQVPPEHHRKLDAHSIDGTLCGFERGSKAYKIWIPSKHKFVTSCNVIIYKKVYSHVPDDTTSTKTTSSEGVPSTSTTALIEGLTQANTNQTRSNTITDSTSHATPLSHIAPVSAQPDPAPSSKSSTEPALKLHCSECVSCPSWKKEAADKQKAE